MGIPKVTVLISGSGSNLQALIDAKEQGTLPIDLVKVVSSSVKAYGLVRASNHSIPTAIHSLYSYTKSISKDDKKARIQARVRFEEELAELILRDAPDLVVCAGWLLILGPSFLKKLGDIPIINLHPALPGAFDGTTHAIEMAWTKCQNDSKPLIAGCMVHYVIEEVDKGEPLVVKELEIVPGAETLDQYAERVHQAEHRAIVEGTIKALQQQKKL
ncbi:HHL260Wp [Eremothecium sinecaudum]|uniref:Phosphoribosylglycinamide formyltransferase n=1 Tax=Eremothecium sinecaudum TaxID=45286 RepID=A0A0X8HW12_9SACH|nr:HHL260Wp [Eremothecium sinecaudum]AMD22510.1 HHL260Wp [Eremothecium sinecaudum]